VARGHPAAVGAVVEVGDRLAQLPHPGDGRVLEVVERDAHRFHPLGRALERSGLRLALAEVAPAVVAVVAGAVAVLGGLTHDVDHAGAGDSAEGAGVVRPIIAMHWKASPWTRDRGAPFWRARRRQRRSN